MLAIELNGGLGNQLFQLAAAETIAAETNRTFSIVNSISPVTAHTDDNYFDSIFYGWVECPKLQNPYSNVNEHSFVKHIWRDLLPTNTSVCLHGYFQNWRYIPLSFPTRLRLPSCSPLQGAFLHVRGGDYVNNWLHDIGIRREYYQRAVKLFPKNTHFYIFTNDIHYAKSLNILEDIPHSYIESDEVTSLAQMASCTDGGICVNSSFSWWGAYLNPNRRIVMPNKWFNDPTIHIEGYYFPGVQKCIV
jgi:hypothetical protein